MTLICAKFDADFINKLISKVTKAVKQSGPLFWPTRYKSATTHPSGVYILGFHKGWLQPTPPSLPPFPPSPPSPIPTSHTRPPLPSP